MLKKIVGSIFGFNEELKLAKQRESNLIKVLGDMEDKAKHWTNKAEGYIKDIVKLKERLAEVQKPVQIPSAEITYRRPVLVGEKQFIQMEIDIRNFIMPDFEMKKELKRKNLLYDKNSDFDELIPKIYHFAKNNYRYGADKKYGFNEYWMFPFELQAVLKKKKAGDCDDWANLIGSYFAAAGVPRNRWLVSLGKSRAGYDHATIYVKDSIGVWRHLNSTKPECHEEDLVNYPANGDKEDMAGIETDGFWFSYNDLFAIHSWDSKQAKEAFKAIEDKISIKVEK